MKSMLICTALFTLVSTMPLDANEPTLSGGFAQVDITPDKPVTMAGYASRKDLSTGVHDSLSARAAVFQSGEHKIVLVSTDIIGFYSGTATVFRQAIMNEFDLEPEELFLSAIHTHAGPTIILDKDSAHPNNIQYTKNLQRKLITAVDNALADMQPVKIGVGTGSSPVGVNRREIEYDDAGNPRMWLGRNPGGVHDKEVSVLKITTADDMLKFVLWEYAVHSTSLGWENLKISGDVHGLAEKFIEHYLGDGVIAPGFAGASGDIDPWYRVLPAFETKNGWIPEPVLMATMLGEEVVHVLGNIDQTSAQGPVKGFYETVELPGKPSGQIETTADHENVPLNVSVARIGNVAFVGLGAEVLTEIGMAIKSASPFKHTIIITHCNGTAGYISPQHRYVEGGYEVETSPFASTAADRLVKRVVKLLHQL